MAGAELVTIKRRIKSVTNTRKITKAMGLIATAKLPKSRVNVVINQGFYSACKDILKEVFENYSKENIYTSGNGSKNSLYIIFTSKMGLCGGFNSNVISKAVEGIKTETGSSRIMMVGERGRTYLNKFGYDVTHGMVEAPDVPTFRDAKNIAEKVLTMFISGEIGQVFAAFTHFVSGVKQTSELQRLLPLPYTYDACYEEIVTFEPSVDTAAEEAVKLYMDEQILYCLLNSTASEYSARMNAMNSATRNADELLDKLKLEFNRVRQSIITQEISEIVGGAEALK